MSHELPWDQARRIAGSAPAPLPVVSARLSEAAGSLLATALIAITDLPAFDTASMDGFAVAGPGPWELDESLAIVAGDSPSDLPHGYATPIATGAPIPIGASAVLRYELAAIEESHGQRRLLAVDVLTGLPTDERNAVRPGTDIRPRGEECRAGDALLDADRILTPSMLGLAAAAGYDEIDIVPPPVVGTLVIGDELLSHGLPRAGRVRDALGPLIPAWVASLGTRANPPVRVPDTRNALIAELDDAAADVIITTGSTSMGPRDHLREVLRDIGAHWIVDGVAVRPGHPMLLARLTDDRYVVGLPGNPLAAVAGLVTLAAPLIRALRGLPPMVATFATLLDDVTSHPHDTRLMPVALSGPGNGLLARPLRFDGPAMLRSLAEADAFVVIAPGAGQRGSTCEVIPLPTPV